MNRILDKNLGHLERILMIYLDNISLNEYVLINKSYIGRELNVSSNSIVSAVNSLEIKGYLKRDNKEFKKYYILK